MSNKPANKESPLLQANGLCKSYGDVQVLNNVSLSLAKGEVRAILGENGAGKSTLVKILSGFVQPSAGSIAIDQAGELHQVSGWQPKQAEANGVVLIHQELNLADQLTVAENIFLGQEIRRGLLLDKQLMRAKTKEYLTALHCDVDPDARVGDLAVSSKQLIEIARTRAKQARVLIMDEPTAVLTSKESEVLYELIAQLSAEGVAIIFISHKLEEIEKIADSVSILRDGELVGNFSAAELSKEDMVRHMVGREISDLFPAKQAPAADSPMALEVSGLTVSGTDSACRFSLRKGEILGLSGLVGSGRTALLESVVGLRTVKQSGSIQVHGKQANIRSLADARKLGVVYLTKDRKGSGLLLEKGLIFNFSLLALQKFSRFLIDRESESIAYAEAVRNFDIRAKDDSIAAGSLSGGNQQKLLLAKIIAADPSIIIIDEPTRGIDIGTKSQIYHFIGELAASGHSVIVISSDIVEVIGLSHRVAVMFHGQLTGILEGKDINEEEIMAYATGLKQQSLSHTTNLSAGAA